MKKILKKISNDVSTEKPFLSPKYKDNNGNPLHGIFIREYKKTQDKLFINNGHLMRLYKYPKIERKFNSDMVNDDNLHLCGGWSWSEKSSDEVLLQRVIDKKKPIGFIVGDDIENLKKFQEIAESEGLESKIIMGTGFEGKYNELCISQKGTFGHNFDIDSLIDDYASFCDSIGNFNFYESKPFLSVCKIRGIEMRDFFSCDYANPSTYGDTIITGLSLGYPIETTVSLMWMY